MPNTFHTDRRPEAGVENSADWSRAYWVMLINQVFVVGIVAFLATGMLRESYKACEAMSLYLPGFTEWYYKTGPSALMWAGLISITLTLIIAGIRHRIVAVIVASLSFIGCIIFLAGGIFASLAPLFVALRDMLPPDQKW